MDAPLDEAASAAELRAQSCRRRIDELEAGVQLHPEDARKAEASLSSAQRREALARQRLEARGQRGWSKDDDCAWVLLLARHRSKPASAASLYQDVLAAGLSVAEVHEYYVSLGGSYSSLDLDAYLHGLAGLPSLEQSVVSQAVWELREWPR
jgi:hypothetical protein